jgi:D-alanine-D-alanine ligase
LGRGGKIGSIKAKRVAVLMGGESGEREISLKTGSSVLRALVESGYNAIGMDAGRDVPLGLRKKRIETVFIALHGRHGEDGCIQGMLEIMGIPYTGSGPRASAVAMDKVMAKKVLSYHGVATPRFAEWVDGAKSPGLRLPLVVKPVREGSGLGVSIVRERVGLKAAFRKAARLGSGVMAEGFIGGRELTVAIFDSTLLPVIEIRPKGELYDYHAKYTRGATEFVVPARLKKNVEKMVLKEALSAYNALGCSGAARVDVLLDRRERPYVLEVNTVPGLTEHSLFPMAAAGAGLSYSRLVQRMLRGASLGKA